MNQSKVFKNKVVDSLADIDYSAMSVPIIVLYDKPKDFPTKYIARVFEADRATNACAIYDSIDEAKADVAKLAPVLRLPRNIEDDKCIVAAWMKV